MAPDEFAEQTKTVSILVHNNYSEILKLEPSNDSFVFEVNALTDIEFNKTNKYLSKLNSIHVFYKNFIKDKNSKKNLKNTHKKTKKNFLSLEC